MPAAAPTHERPCLTLNIHPTNPQVGDEGATADPAPAEAQDYFAMLREPPEALLARLLAQWGSADGTPQRVAALLGCSLVSGGPLLPCHLPLLCSCVQSCSMCDAELRTRLPDVWHAGRARCSPVCVFALIES